MEPFYQQLMTYREEVDADTLRKLSSARARLTIAEDRLLPGEARRRLSAVIDELAEIITLVEPDPVQLDRILRAER